MLRAACLVVVICILCVSPVFAQGALQSDRTVLVAGNPPLQRNTVEDLAGFLEWVFRTRLTDAQKQAFQDILVDTWTRGDRNEINYWVEMLRARIQAGNLAPPSNVEMHESMSLAALKDMLKYTKRGQELGRLFIPVVNRPAQASAAPGTGAAGNTAAAPVGYPGTYTTSAGGNTVTLTLDQDASGRVAGELSSTTGARFSLSGSLNEKGSLSGISRAAQGAGYFLAELSGSALTLTLADPMLNGQPNMLTARRIQLQRTDEPRAGAAQSQERSSSSGGPGAQAPGTPNPMDQQITQLLLRSAWCSFSYSGVAGSTSGTSRTERVVFRLDGSGQLSSGSESYYSNPYGSAGGQRTGGRAFRWQVQNGILNLSFNGGPVEPTPLRISRNSNGYPIITASGKEYSTCN